MLYWTSKLKINLKQISAIYRKAYIVGYMYYILLSRDFSENVILALLAKDYSLLNIEFAKNIICMLSNDI